MKLVSTSAFPRLSAHEGHTKLIDFSMRQTAVGAPITPARTNTTKMATRGITTWLLDASIALALTGAIALAITLTSHQSQ